MGNIFYFGWEEQYLIWLQHLGGTGVLHSVLLFFNNVFSMFGEETVCVAIMGLVYWGIDKEKGRRIGAVVITANICNGMIKNIFRRLRPYQTLEQVELLRKVDGFSFPSGHSANAAALYPTTAYEFKKIKWFVPFAVAIPLLVAISRNYLGAHWPTDVIFGLLQGFIVFLVIEFLHAKVKNQYLLYLCMLAVFSVGMFYCKTSDYYNSYGMLIGLLFGTLFEEKAVRFENSNRLPVIVSRTIFGAVCYLASNAVLKSLIGDLFPTDTAGYFMMRTLRYALVTFLLIGVYPLTFRLEKCIRRSQKS